MSDLTELDTLRVTGIGKKLISIVVTTGHGELALTNTDLFEGSFIQIGSKNFCGSDQRYDNGAAGRHLYCDGGK